MPYSGDGFKLSIPSKWNPSKEVEFPGQVLRYEDNFDTTSNLSVMITPTDKKSITDYGSPEEFLSSVDYLLGKQAYFGKTDAEGGFDSGAVATANILESSSSTVGGKPYYFLSVLTRTADGDEGGKHQLITATAPRFADLGLFTRFDPPSWPPIRALLRLGLPMGVSVFMEGSLFVATALLVGTLGTTQMAAHQIAILMASLCFMVPLGVAMATTVRVGHAVGAGDLPGVRWSAAAGFSLAMIAQTLSAVVLVAGAAWLAALFTTDPAVIALASLLMAYAAVFQYPDGLQALSAGSLRGLKDVRVPMIITVLAYWGFGLPLGAWLGISQGQGAPGLWTGLILGLSVAATLLGWRFWRMARRPLPAVHVT